jgi:hypothetical protein
MRSFVSLSVLTLLFSFPEGTILADEWGNIKGRVVYGENKPFVPVELRVTKDRDHCLSKGKILSEKYVVNPRNNGVRNVVVWVAAEQDGKANHKAELRIHPSLKDIPADNKQVVIDSPCCRFEPHVVVLRKGQEIVGKNSAPIAHSMILNGPSGESYSTLLPPNHKIVLPAERWKPHHLPVVVHCAIHTWMKAYVFVLGHPYSAVTDEDGNFEIKNVPAGKFRLMMWQEGVGWLLAEEGKHRSNGKGITVEAGKTLDVGKVPLMLAKEDRE